MLLFGNGLKMFYKFLLVDINVEYKQCGIQNLHMD